MAERQIKSKQRVAEHGEVFTAQREVNAMLDLVEGETERIDSRFLEPACGEGAFLCEILRRKLAVVSERYGKSFPDYERNAVHVVMTLYGIDIMPDNAQACRERLFDIWNAEYTQTAGREANDECREVVRYILNRNILCGDALTMLQSDGTPIIFSQWDFITGDLVKRLDYTLDALMRMNQEKPVQLTVYDEWQEGHESQPAEPKPVAEFKISSYKDLTKPVLLSCNPLMAEYYGMEVSGAGTAPDAQP